SLTIMASLLRGWRDGPLQRLHHNVTRRYPRSRWKRRFALAAPGQEVIHHDQRPDRIVEIDRSQIGIVPVARPDGAVGDADHPRAADDDAAHAGPEHLATRHVDVLTAVHLNTGLDLVRRLARMLQEHAVHVHIPAATQHDLIGRFALV